MADTMLRVFIRLTCTADKLNASHAKADANFVYVIQNDLLTDWDISLHFKQDQNIDFHRHADPRRPMFDDRAMSYESDPLPASVLADLFTNRTNNQAHMTIKVTFKKFSRVILDHMTRTVDDLHNLADPDPGDKAGILASFVERPGARKRDYTFPEESREIKDIPCHLDSFNAIGNAGAILTFHLDIQKLPEKDRREAILTLMAADHSKLLELGAESATGETKKRIDVWTNNVIGFMVNYTNVVRAQKIFDDIVRFAKDAYENNDPSLQTQENLVLHVRNAIDIKMITANHWADDRENEPGEEFQFAMSNVFGSILQSKKYASLVMLVRGIDADLAKPQDEVRKKLAQERDAEKIKVLQTQLRRLELDERKDWALYILQSGVGHCGEHANVSFFILRTLMETKVSKGKQIKALLGSIILSGNANIQHDFVIGGMRPGSIIKAVGRIDNSLRPKVKKGEVIQVIDLEKLLKEHPGEDGFVCDPYLSLKKQKISLRALLKKITSHPVQALRTVAVGASLFHPPDPEVPFEFSRTQIDGV
jgi:hypothetical protein